MNLNLALLMSALIAGRIGAADQAPDIGFTIDLASPQRATLVVEDESGLRVRNLIAETLLPAGKNRIAWDGYDDGTVDKDGNLVRHRVKPGTYRARGLTHDGIKLLYEFTVYGGGDLPWPTKDNMGGWLADHSSPLGATFIPSGSPYGDGRPQVLLTALVAECGAPTVWVATDGKVVQRRALWGWDGGEAAATDLGPGRDPRFYAYVLKCFGDDDGITIRGLGTASAPDVVSWKPSVKMPREPRELGLALTIRDGLGAFTAPLDDAVVLFEVKDGKAGRILGSVMVQAPKGVLIDHQGRLLVSSNGTVRRYAIVRSADAAPRLDKEEVLIKGLEDPRTIQCDLAGKELYVADWGASNQVKVFDLAGKPLRTIGRRGGFQLGAYDEQRMMRPQGLAIDDRGQLWVAEADWLPKRVSVWDAASGKLIRAAYGPPHYGGGGTIDPQDKTRLFYGEYGGTLEFKLDWTSGKAALVAVPIRHDVQNFGPMTLHSYGGYGPERAWHVNGRTYLTLGYQGGLRYNDVSAIYLYDDKTRTARPVAHIGSMRHWEAIRTASWIGELQKEGGIYEPFLTWSDRNADHIATRDEFSVRRFTETVEGKPLFGFRFFYPRPDLAMEGSWNLEVPAPTFLPDGTPVYDLAKATFAVPPARDQHWEEDGNTGMRLSDGSWTTGTKGWKDGRWMWNYPSTNEAWSPPTHPGEMCEPTRVMGPPFTPARSEAKDIICINGERGNFYLLTGDGLFIQTLAGHRMTSELMRLPKATRGMDVSRYSFEDEHFHPTITCTKDGEVYIVAGKEHTSIFRVDGFASLHKRSFGQASLSAAQLARLPETLVVPGRKQGRLAMVAKRPADAPAVDGKLDEWSDAAWIDVGSSGKAALAIHGDRLYAAWRTGNPEALVNEALTDPAFAFKRGGAVDLMVGPEGHDGRDPGPGDVRLLACQVKGKNLAVLYRQAAGGARLGKAQHYESPIGSVDFADVAVVSDQVQLAASEGNVELSVPLALLGISGKEFRGDIGILRGNGSQTVQRTYWNNLDSAMVSDIPTEARLQPANWGRITIAP